MTLVDRIWLLLEEKEMTAYRLAKEVSLPTSQLSQWKSGKVKPSLEAVRLIADYFNVSIDYLLGRTDNPEINKWEMFI